MAVCFDRLNKSLAARPTQTKARPPSSTAVKPGSRYVDTPSASDGEASEVEKAALSLWRSILFDPFQERLLNIAMAKITEDRDSSYTQLQDFESVSQQQRATMGTGAGSSPNSDAYITSTAPSPANGIGKSATTSHFGKDLWVPMGGDTLVSDLMHNILRMGDVMVSSEKLRLYELTFEKTYLNHMVDYFKRESALYISSQGITPFISLAVLRMNQEELRSTRYLHTSSKQKVTASLHQVLIITHKEAMLAEFEHMLQFERISQMNALYSLLSRLDNGCEELKKILADWMLRTSELALRTLVSASSDPVAASASSSATPSSTSKPQAMGGSRKKSERGNAANVPPSAYAETMTQLHLRFTHLVSHAFNDDVSFVTTMDRAYKESVNSNAMCDDPTLGPELLARQSDALLRKGTLSLSESELESKLGHLVTIFKYVDDKDIFQNFYAKLLAKRLISASSISDDTERAMIASLKPISSSVFTLRVQRMFTDIQLSKEVSAKFQAFVSELPAAAEGVDSLMPLPSCSSAPSHPTPTSAVEGHKSNSEMASLMCRVRPSVTLDFSVFVLTTGSWPLQESQSSFNVPEQISEYLSLFSGFYNTLHTGRKLNWLYNMHRGEVRIQFAKKKYDIGASAFQLGTLLAFESCSATSMGATETNVSSGTLGSLSVDQLTVILGLPPTETLALAKNLLDCKLLVISTGPSQTSSSHSSPPPHGEIPSSEGATSAAGATTTDHAKPKRSSTTASSVHGSTLLQLNTSFANKKIKFKLPPPVPTDAAKSAAQSAARDEIDGDRTQFLQAVIVRTMKTRKSLTHTQLMQEVLDQSKNRFKASIAFIKRQIDSLIEMEYLTRSKEKADVYLYCA